MLYWELFKFCRS